MNPGETHDKWRERCRMENAAFCRAMIEAGYEPTEAEAIEEPEPSPQIKVVRGTFRYLFDAGPEWGRPARLVMDVERPTMAGIALDVARRYGLTLDDLKSESRNQLFVRARFEAWHRIRREVPGCSLPVIGRFFNRHHASVLHGLRKYEELTNDVVA